MWELDHKGGWALKNWCFQIVMLENTLESPLDSKDIKPVHPKGNQSWIFTERIETEAAILWPPDVKNRLTGKDPDAEKDWRQREKRVAEDEMIRWHHQFNWHKFEQTPEIVEDRGAWHAVVHGFAKSRTQLSDLTTISIREFCSGIIKIVEIAWKYYFHEFHLGPYILVF